MHRSAVAELGPSAEQHWCSGDMFTAMELADRALAAGSDPGGHAAGVAAAAAAADGALHDAARRWRAVSAAVADPSRAMARAALAAALAGDVAAAEDDLEQARRLVPDPAPRTHAALVEGAAAAIGALRGDPERAARRLAGLAAASVAPDPLAVDRFDELAACALAAIGDGRAARALLDRPTGAAATTTETAVATIVAATAVATTTGAATTARRPLLAAWLDLRAGRYAAAGDGLVAAASTPVLRRDAVLAAAVSVGLARRSGGERSLAATWHRVAPVVAGADVEILLLDVWGELSVAAALVSPGEQHGIAEAMAAAVARAGNPWWALATDCWWRLARADAAADTADAARAAAALAALAADQPLARPAAAAAAVWADALAGTAAPGDVARTAADLAARGHRFEAERLCATAADRATEPDAARALLGAGRRLRERPTGAVATVPDALSPREREVGALVIDGLTHKEIGRNLYISPKTVEQHVARMRQKLAATTRADLVAALRANL